MKSRKLIVLGSAVLAIAVMAVFVFAMSQTGLAGNFFAFNTGQPASASRDGVTILARRLTSIPFGIDDIVTLSENGKILTVTGWGNCPATGPFTVKVKVSQDGVDGLAVGRTEGYCVNGTRITWQAETTVPDSKPFTLGSTVLACGHLVLHAEDSQGAMTNDWCSNGTITN